MLVHICEECVALCVGILTEKGVWPSPLAWGIRSIRTTLRIFARSVTTLFRG